MLALSGAKRPRVSLPSTNNAYFAVNQLYSEYYTRTLIECHSPGTMYVRKWGSCTRRVRYDWIAAFPGNLPPAAKEWVEVGGYDNAAGTRETAEMWNVSWIFAPVTVQKHDIVTAVQLRKDS